MDTSRPSVERRRVYRLESAAEGVVIDVHRHRLLPPVAVEPDLIVEPVRAARGGGRTLVRHDTDSVHPHFDTPIVPERVSDVVHHAGPPAEPDVRQAVALPASVRSRGPDGEGV